MQAIGGPFRYIYLSVFSVNEHGFSDRAPLVLTDALPVLTFSIDDPDESGTTDDGDESGTTEPDDESGTTEPDDET
jgi:hypothetical protein